jgi:hypothetical protein
MLSQAASIIDLIETRVIWNGARRWPIGPLITLGFLGKTAAKSGTDPCKRQGEGARRVPPIAIVAA